MKSDPTLYIYIISIKVPHTLKKLSDADCENPDHTTHNPSLSAVICGAWSSIVDSITVDLIGMKVERFSDAAGGKIKTCR